MSEASPQCPACPRCGYDQSGAVATWTNACPLDGTCPECGLRFAWTSVLGRHAGGPRWSVEHGDRLSVTRLIRATFRATFQRGLWRTFDIAAPIQPRRLITLIIVSAAANHLLLASTISLSRLVADINAGFRFHQPWSPALWLVPYDKSLEVPLGAGASAEIPVGPLLAITFMTFLVPPLVMLIFVETMSRVGVRKTHILRGAAYMAPALAPATIILLGALAAAMLVQWTASGGGWATAIVTLAVLASWPLLQTWRWRQFTHHYLRLPQPSWIALSILVILGLSIAIAIVLAAGLA